MKDFSLHKCREKLYPRKITYMTHNHIMVMWHTYYNNLKKKTIKGHKNGQVSVISDANSHINFSLLFSQKKKISHLNRN